MRARIFSFTVLAIAATAAGCAAGFDDTRIAAESLTGERCDSSVAAGEVCVGREGESCLLDELISCACGADPDVDHLPTWDCGPVPPGGEPLCPEGVGPGSTVDVICRPIGATCAPGAGSDYHCVCEALVSSEDAACGEGVWRCPSEPPPPARICPRGVPGEYVTCDERGAECTGSDGTRCTCIPDDRRLPPEEVLYWSCDSTDPPVPVPAPAS